MKKYLILLLALVTNLCPAENKPVTQGDLSQPIYSNKTEEPGMFAPRLKKHIDSGDLVAFYKEATQIFRSWPDLDPNGYTDIIYIDRMWVCYYVANAPMFKTDFDETVSYPFRDDDDISAKISTVSCIERFVRQDILNSGLSLKSKSIREQMMAYCARIFRDFRSAYDPDLEAKVEMMKKTPKPVKSLIHAKILHNKYSINTRRNTKLLSNMESYEEDFVQPLIKFYNGKAHEVRKLIKAAGYTDEEGADLIDRTVGRNKNTEFLYQGKYGRRHDKKTTRHKSSTKIVLNHAQSDKISSV